MWYWLLNTRWIRRNAMELWRRRQVRVRRGPWNFLSAAAMTVWLAKSIEIFLAKRRLRLASDKLASVRSTFEGIEQLADSRGELEQFLDAAATELKGSSGVSDAEGIKERVASRLDRIEAGYARRILRGTGVLATIGATAPFVGLFGTVWGIMDS